MSPLDAVVGFVLAERVAELAYSRRNTRRLLARGGVEHGAGHYPLFVLLHGAWLTAIWLGAPEPAPRRPELLASFLALQPLRLWIIISLGERWTTRVITVPGAGLVRRGPYRLLSHPNYLLVVLEIALLPLAFGMGWLAAVASLANALLLRHRIHVEEQALELARASRPSLR